MSELRRKNSAKYVFGNMNQNDRNYFEGFPTLTCDKLNKQKTATTGVITRWSDHVLKGRVNAGWRQWKAGGGSHRPARQGARSLPLEVDAAARAAHPVPGPHPGPCLTNPPPPRPGGESIFRGTKEPLCRKRIQADPSGGLWGLGCLRTRETPGPHPGPVAHRPPHGDQGPGASIGEKDIMAIFVNNSATNRGES